jgi:putative polyhydroxyalkanoate system protein
MADIHLEKKHKLGIKKAKTKAQKLADQLAADYDLQSQWDGDTLMFERSGVSGSLLVSKDNIELDMKLGFLMSAFAPKIQEQIQANLDKFLA